MRKIAIIWENNKKIGYSHTRKEADDICKKKINYTWSLEDNANINKKNLVFMTTSYY